MKVDYVSDIHVDNYFADIDSITNDKLLTFAQKIFKVKQSDIVIIAGDLAEDNEIVISFLKILKKYFYRHIIYVVGNHEYYLKNIRQQERHYYNSRNKVKQLIRNINRLENIYCLDGTIIEIEGVKFGGACGWYSNDFVSRYYEAKLDIIAEEWKNTLDSQYIFGINSFEDLCNLERVKLEKIHQECDVMISHINPSCAKEHLPVKFKDKLSSTFFTFDGHSLMHEGSMKYWIFGHTHSKLSFKIAGVQCLCNPMGCPNENPHFEIESFEI